MTTLTLVLLHPLQSVPVQNWTFREESVVRIGRSTDNDVVLYSAVVSRHHVELRLDGDQWRVVNLGTNGTYINDKRVDDCDAKDGLVFRLASSGPKIQIRLEIEEDADEFDEINDTNYGLRKLLSMKINEMRY